MDLDDYLRRPGSLTVGELRDAIGAPSSAQVRQWRYRYAGRRPSPAYCAAIEAATGGAVRRQDLRDDWRDIWPELAEGERNAA